MPNRRLTAASLAHSLKQAACADVDIMWCWALHRQACGFARRRGGRGLPGSQSTRSPSFHSGFASSFHPPAPGFLSVLCVDLRFGSSSPFDRLRRAAPASTLSQWRSRHAAPRGLPPPPARGLPPRRACARQPARRWPIRRNTEPLFRSLRLPAQRLCESQAAKPRP